METYTGGLAEQSVTHYYAGANKISSKAKPKKKSSTMCKAKQKGK